MPPRVLSPSASMVQASESKGSTSSDGTNINVNGNANGRRNLKKNSSDANISFDSSGHIIETDSSISGLGMNLSGHLANTYSECESAYLTSEEMYFDVPDTLNDGPTTPISKNPKKLRKGGKEDGAAEANGVHLNPVLAGLLGVSLLPFVDDNTKDEERDFTGFDATPTSDEDRCVQSLQNEDFLDSPYSSDDEINASENYRSEKQYDEPVDLGNSDRKKSKCRKGPLRRLRRQLDKPQKMSRRKQRKLAKGKSKRRGLMSGVSANIENEILQIEHGRKRLQAVKANLRSTQSSSRRLMSEARQSEKRVSKLSKTVTELECQLDMALRALEQEKSKIDINLAKLAHLNASEQFLKDESVDIESKLRSQLSLLEKDAVDVPAIYTSGLDLDDSYEAGSPLARSRTNTDCSFMTAYELSSPGIVSGTKPKSRFNSEAVRKPDVEVPRHRTKSECAPHSPCVESPPPQVTSSVYPAFVRIHDLDVDEKMVKSLNSDRLDLFPVHNSESHHVLNSLMKLAFNCATDESNRWTGDRPTDKIISKRPDSEKSWHHATDDDIFVWSGKFDNGGYKSECPVIKARAMVPSTSRALLDLLFDSSKVQQYNKMSLGRKDEHFIKEGIETDDGRIHGEAKVVRSVSTVPMIRKNLELLSLMHARSLLEDKDGMKGYICVTRSVWESEERAPTATSDGDGADKKYIRCESLLGVNLIRDVDEGKCEITTINHFYTPGAPTFGAKQFGMKAAGNFLRDLRKQFQ